MKCQPQPIQQSSPATSKPHLGEQSNEGLDSSPQADRLAQLINNAHNPETMKQELIAKLKKLSSDGTLKYENGKVVFPDKDLQRFFTERPKLARVSSLTLCAYGKKSHTLHLISSKWAFWRECREVTFQAHPGQTVQVWGGDERPKEALLRTFDLTETVLSQNLYKIAFGDQKIFVGIEQKENHQVTISLRVTKEVPKPFWHRATIFFMIVIVFLRDEARNAIPEFKEGVAYLKPSFGKMTQAVNIAWLSISQGLVMITAIILTLISLSIIAGFFRVPSMSKLISIATGLASQKKADGLQSGKSLAIARPLLKAAEPSKPPSQEASEFKKAFLLQSSDLLASKTSPIQRHFLHNLFQEMTTVPSGCVEIRLPETEGSVNQSLSLLEADYDKRGHKITFKVLSPKKKAFSMPLSFANLPQSERTTAEIAQEIVSKMESNLFQTDCAMMTNAKESVSEEHVNKASPLRASFTTIRQTQTKPSQ